MPALAASDQPSNSATVRTRFETRLSQLLASEFPPALGLAVSGGGDSTALMHIAAGWAADAGCRIDVATVDHGLRPEAASESQQVGYQADSLGLSHQILRWSGWDGAGNLQDAARRARYRLLSDWARERAIPAVLLGHTQDDNVECFVLGVARGAGLDGLSGMRPTFDRAGVTFLRPLLSVTRGELRGWLKERDIRWSEDPSNEETRFARVRVRQALGLLGDIGVTSAAIARSVDNLRRTRAGIDALLHDFAKSHTRCEAGDVIVEPDAFAALPDEMARRLLNAALRWVSGTDYPPRAEKVANLLANADARRAGRTLHGCLVRAGRGGLRISREPEAVIGTEVPAGSIWDGRWRVEGKTGPGMKIRCLGADGLAALPDWRSSGLPRATCLASPAVWDAAGLVAAPLLDPDCRFRAETATDFAETLRPRV